MAMHYWCCGWESGNHQWASGNAGPGASVSAAAAISGDHGLLLNPSSQTSAAGRLVAGVSRGYATRFKLRLPASLPTGSRKTLMLLSSEVPSVAANGYYFVFDPADARLKIIHVQSGVDGESVSGPVVSADVVYRIDMFFRGGDYDAPTGQGLDWQVDGVPQTSLEDEANIFTFVTHQFGSRTSDTFTAHIDDVWAGWGDALADDVGTAALYPRGDGYCRRLEAVSNGPNNNEGQFLASAGSLNDSWDLLNDTPYLTSTGYVRQVTADTSAYLQYSFEPLDPGETPHALSVVYERAVSSGLVNRAKIHMLSGGIDTTIYDGQFQGPAVRMEDLVPGQPFTRAQINAMLVRWGYSSDVSPEVRLGGLHLEVDVGGDPVPEPVVVVPTGDTVYYDQLLAGEVA
jgi:hypothetical protein